MSQSRTLEEDLLRARYAFQNGIGEAAHENVGKHDRTEVTVWRTHKHPPT